MSAGPDLGRLWRRIGVGTLVLTAIAAIPLLATGHGRVALGMAIGAALLIGDIYLLKAPIDLMLARVARSKRPWVMVLTLGRMVLLGAVLLLLVKFRIASVAGLFLGVTLPLIAIVGLFVTGRIEATDEHR